MILTIYNGKSDVVFLWHLRRAEPWTQFRVRSAVTRVTASVLTYTNKHGGEKAMEHRRRFLKIYLLKFCDIWQNFYFYRILNNETFKMDLEQTIFETHSIITVQLYYWLSKNLSVKIWSNKTLFTWSGGPRSSGVSFFCFVSPRAWKQKKQTPLDRGPPLHVNRP